MPTNMKIRKGQSFQAVQAGSTANVPLVTKGPTYFGLFPIYKASGVLANDATIAADIEVVRVKVNTDDVIELTGAELLAIADFYAWPRQPGVLPIYFSRPEFDTLQEEEFFALGTADVDTLSLEIQLASGALAPELDLRIATIAGAARPAGRLIRYLSKSYGAQGAAGLVELTDLPVRGPGRFMKAMHIQASTVDDHEIVAAKGTVRGTSDEAEDAINQMVQDIQAFRVGGRVPQAGYYHIDFAGGHVSAMRGMDLDEFTLKLNLNGVTPAYKIIVEEMVGSPS